jgi:cobalt-zinc-cadmium efflux system outer membrane protein
MRKRIAVLAAAVLVSAAIAGAQTSARTVSVADLVDLALQQNRELMAARQRLVETQGLVRQAGVRPAPALEFEGSTGRPLGSPGEQAFSLGYFHTIETAGKRDKRLSVAQKSSDAAQAELSDRVRLLMLDVKVKYARAVREQQKLQTIQRLASTNREYYGLMEARVKTGDAAPLEGRLLLAEVGRVEAQRVGLAASAERALLGLRQTTGMLANEPFSLVNTLPPSFAPSDVAQLQARALRDRPDLRVLQLVEEETSAEETLTRAEARPDLTAFIRYSRVDTGFDQLGYEASGALAPIRSRDHVLTVGLSVLLVGSNRNRGAVEAVQAKGGAARFRREHLETVIRLEVEAAYHRWQAALAVIEILNREVIQLSDRNLTVLRAAYGLGQLRMLDVLSEQRRLIDTQLAVADAQSEVLEALAELEASIGGPLQ